MEAKGTNSKNVPVLRIRASKKSADGSEADSRRKKRKRRAKGETPHENLQGGESPETKSLVWSDKYKPSDKIPFVGNVEATKELRNWLSEWKESPANRQALHSSDSEASVEAGLSNCMLLCGPPGSGKTACVYYMAQELGYKVIEVNASSERPGKKILAQLQEATQSHHVEGGKTVQEFRNLFPNHVKPAKDKEARASSSEDTAAKKVASVTKNPRRKGVVKPKAAAGGTLTHYFTAKVQENVEEEICVVEEIEKESPKATLLDYFSSGVKKEQQEAKSKTYAAESAIEKKASTKDSVKKKASASSVVDGDKVSSYFSSRVEKQQLDTKSKNALAKNGMKKKGAASSKADADEVEVVDVIVINDSAKRKKMSIAVKREAKNVTTIRGKERKPEIEKRMKPPDVSEDVPAPSLTYSSLTLILFDDVDVIFQQDDGFWNAVESVLQVTKKPVLFTATRDIDHVRSKLPSHCPLVELTQPTAAETSHFLEDVLKIENSSLIKTLDFLVQYYHCDLRRCLLQLQFETAGARNSNNKKPRDSSRRLWPTNVSQDELCKILRENSATELCELQVEFGHLGINVAYLTLHNVLSLRVAETEAKPIIFREEYHLENMASDSTLNVSWLADTSTEEDNIRESETKEWRTKREATKHAPVVSESLRELSDLFDAFSTADAIRGASWKASKFCQSLQPLERMYAYCEGKALCGDETSSAGWLEMPAHVEVSSVKAAAEWVTKHVSSSDEVPELCSVFVHTLPRLSNLEETTRRKRSLQRNIAKILQSTTQAACSGVAALLPDYASALHQICFFEQERRVRSSNRGRRFLHYLNSCNVFLSAKDTDTLCNQWLAV